MGPTRTRERASEGLERIRRQLMTSFQLGRLAPGERVPSVRSMARITGLNRKTVHRAYLRLAREGLLELRWGSGTYFSDDVADSRAESPSPTALLALFERFRSEAVSLGVEEDDLPALLALLAGDDRRGVPLAVVACNREQTGMIGRELDEAGIGRTTAVPLEACAERADELARRFAGIVTTDCHRAEVEAALAGRGLPVYRVALEPEFPDTIGRWSRRGPVVMIVDDPRFGDVFLRLLDRMRIGERKNIGVVEAGAAAARVASSGPGAAVWVSPLVASRASGAIGERSVRIETGPYVESRSREVLRVRLALEEVRRRKKSG